MAALRAGALGLVGALLLSTACLSNGDGTTGANGLGLKVDAVGGTLSQGASLNVGLTVTRVGGSVSEVALSVEHLPDGVTASQTVQFTLGTTAVITLTLQAGTAVPGNYNLTIRARAAGLSDATQPFLLTIR